MRFDDIGIRRIGARNAPTLLRLVKDDVDRTDQGVGEVKRCDVTGQSTDFLEAGNHWNEPFEERLDVSVDEPTHTRTTTLPLFMHEANEFRILCDEMDMGADTRADRSDGIAGFGSAAGLEGRRVESASNLAKGLIHGSLPELEFVAEVVAEEAEGYVRSAGDLASRRAVEAFLGEDLLCCIEDASTHLG